MRSNRLITAAVSLAAAAGFAVIAAPPASADTETCVSRGEYDNLVTGLTVNQVYNRFDVYGIYIGDNENVFRRAYRPCWAPGEKQVVVAFSYNSGETVDWWVRDV